MDQGLESNKGELGFKLREWSSSVCVPTTGCHLHCDCGKMGFTHNSWTGLFCLHTVHQKINTSVSALTTCNNLFPEGYLVPTFVSCSWCWCGRKMQITRPPTSLARLDSPSPLHTVSVREHKITSGKSQHWGFVIPQTISVVLFDSECLITFQIYFQSF